MIRKSLIPLWFTLGLIIVILTFNRNSSFSIMGFLDGFSKIEFKSSISNFITSATDVIDGIGLLELEVDFLSFPEINGISDVLKIFTYLYDVISTSFSVVVNSIIATISLVKYIFIFLFDFLVDFVSILKFIATYLIGS